MIFRVVLSAAALALTSSLAPVAAVAAPAHVVSAAHQHACTRTSTGKYIRGGEFCPESKYRKSGWDAHGRRYVCKGNREHPHWEKP